MELYVLRHGTTIWNEKALLQGDTDIPLDENGIRLAEELGKALQHTRFDKCYSSPLSRAMQTAELALGGRDLPIMKEPRLREMGFGVMEGKHVSRDSKEADPGLLKALYVQMEGYVPPKGGETLQHLLDRTRDFFEELVRNPENENLRILISTHGAAGRAFMHSIWGGSFWHGEIPPNCSICTVSIHHGDTARAYIQKDVIFYDKSEVRDWYK